MAKSRICRCWATPPTKPLPISVYNRYWTLIFRQFRMTWPILCRPKAWNGTESRSLFIPTDVRHPPKHYVVFRQRRHVHVAAVGVFHRGRDHHHSANDRAAGKERHSSGSGKRIGTPRTG